MSQNVAQNTLKKYLKHSNPNESKLSKEKLSIIEDNLGDSIISAELPLTILDCPEFVIFCHSLNSDFTVPGKVKLKNSILQAEYIKSNEYLYDNLAHCNYVSLSLDGWSSRRMYSMFGIIVNYVDSQGVYKSDLLAIKLFKGLHIAEKIAKFTLDLTNRWNISYKIIRIPLTLHQTLSKHLLITLKIRYLMIFQMSKIIKK